MLKKPIKYTDYNDEEQTEVFYFNVSKPELLKLLSEEGMIGKLGRLVEKNDIRGALQTFEDIILLAYGERSDDGKQFFKSEEMKQGFLQHAAYEALFTELTKSDKTMSDFMVDVMPKDFRDEINKKLAELDAKATT